MPLLRLTFLPLSLALVYVSPAHAQTSDLDRQVGQLFEKRCADCHFEGDKDGRKGKKPFLNATSNRLALSQLPDRLLVLGKPDDSELFRLVSLPPDHEDRMPKNKKAPGEEGYVAPLTAAEQQLIKRWITGEAATPAATRVFIHEEQVLLAVLADLETLPEAERADTRYLTLHNLWNLGPADEPESNCALYRAAASKLLNSLSWSPKITVPAPVGANQTLLRVRLSAYGWTPATWSRVAGHYPYGFLQPKLDTAASRLTGCVEPVVLRADWFVFAASQSPFYEEILFHPKVPAMAGPGAVADYALEQYLGINLLANLRLGLESHELPLRDKLAGKKPEKETVLPVFRAGFKNSGISLANRLLERHDLSEGQGYWKSYDFNITRQQGEGDLFQFPLGPTGSGLSEHERLAFRHDGGEIIFHLPNGLQGYLLTNATGNYLARAPSDIVHDNNRRDGIILNGISCIKCHENGMRRPPGTENGLARDEIRPGVQALLANWSENERRAIASLYASGTRLNAALKADSERFQSSLRKTGATGFPVEPVGFLYDRFLRDITADTLLTELDFNPTDAKVPLSEVLSESGNDLIRSKANQLGRGFRRAEFIPLFRALAKELGGLSLRNVNLVEHEEFKGQIGRATNRDSELASASPLAGQGFTIPGLNLDMVPIPAGSFMMGSETGEENEKPVHKVTLTKAFWMGKTEVTQAQWKTIMGDSPSGFKGGNLPVEQVSWDECLRFCLKLTEREQAAGRLPSVFAYTLPTEAQWEYACRAGTTGDITGGLDLFGWYEKNAGYATHTVGEKKANAFGLYDMHGNVSEWCADYWSDSYGHYTSPIVADPKGVVSGSHRVERGGNYGASAFDCRFSFRPGFKPDVHLDNLGFRLALSAAQ